MGEAGQFDGRSSVGLFGRVLYGYDALVSQWVCDHIDGAIASPDARGLGVIVNGKMAAGVMYERCNGVHLEASIAALPGVGWADRSTLFKLFHYPFGTLGVEAISVLVPSSNQRSLRLATGLGFAPEAMVSFAAPDGSTLIILKMFKDRCRWIEHGQRVEKSTNT